MQTHRPDHSHISVKLLAANPARVRAALFPAQYNTVSHRPPYFEAGQVMVIKLPRIPITLEVSLAVEYGSDADAAARHLARRRAGIEIKYTPSAEDALKAAANGWADAAIVDGVSARQLLSEFPELQMAEQVTSDPYVIAVWGDSTQLLEAINAKLAEMKQDGTLERMVEEWMGK